MIEPARIRRILVRANNWIGDVVMISPAIRALRERFRGAEIAILARPWVCDALAANPFFDRLIPYEAPGRHGGLTGRLRLARELRRGRFDLADDIARPLGRQFLAALAFDFKEKRHIVDPLHHKARHHALLDALLRADFDPVADLVRALQNVYRPPDDVLQPLEYRIEIFHRALPQV